MAEPRNSWLASIANVLFAERHAAAQKQLWELCAYGARTTAPGEKPLHEKIQDAVKRGAKIDVQNADGDTPLMLVCRRGLPFDTKCLLELGADIRFTNNKGETAFTLAAAAGEGWTVTRLIDKGIDPKSTDPSGRDAAYLLVHAVIDFKNGVDKEWQAKGLVRLLSEGLTLDDHLKMAIYHHKPHLLSAVPEIEPVHALATSAAAGSAENVKLLLDLGINPDAPASYKDDTPLCAGTSAGNLEMMDALLASGADVNLKSPKTHRTPLQTAVRAGQVDAFDLLLEKGAKIDAGMELLELARDNGGKPIMRAVYEAMIERGIMKTEVDTAKTAMKTIRLKTPGAA